MAACPRVNTRAQALHDRRASTMRGLRMRPHRPDRFRFRRLPRSVCNTEGGTHMHVTPLGLTDNMPAGWGGLARRTSCGPRRKLNPNSAGIGL